jgi:hypothetical protein
VKDRPSSLPLRAEAALVAALVALFLLLGGLYLDRPGLAHAESLDAFYGMSIAGRLPQTLFVDWGVRLGGYLWPLRIPHPYDFAVFDLYWAALAFKLCGVSVAVLRGACLCLGAAVLVLFYALCRAWLGVPAALAAAALLAVNPAFLAGSRVAYWAMEIQLLVPETAVLLLFTVWHRSKKPWALYAGAFVWGLATCVTTKSTAFLVAYPVLYLALVPRDRRPSARQTAAAAAFAALGAADFLAFNAAHGLLIVKALTGALRGRTAAGVDNHAVLANAGKRLLQLARMLQSGFSGSFTGPGAPRDLLLPFAFFISFAAAARRCAAERSFRGRGLVLLSLCLMPLLLLQTAFTPYGLDKQHVLVLWPWPLFVVAASLDELRLRLDAARPRAGALASGALLAVLAASSLRADAGLLRRLAAGHQEGAWSDAVTDLTRYLEKAGASRPYCLSPLTSMPVTIISGGRVNPWNVIPEAAARPVDYARLSGEAGALFLTADFSPGAAAGAAASADPEEAALRRAARRAGRRLILAAAFPENGRRPRFAVWRFQAPGQPVLAGGGRRPQPD